MAETPKTYRDNHPTFSCPKCGKSYGLTNDAVVYGLWDQGRLVRCATCLSEIKQRFWLRLAIEEDYDNERNR